MSESPLNDGDHVRNLIWSLAKMSKKPTPLNDLDPNMRIEQSIGIPPREGMAKTIYYYSYSGALVIAEPLPTLWGNLNGAKFEIGLARLGHPSFRATPQFTNRTFEALFGAPPGFPVQVASFAAPATESGATINYWFGPTEDVQPRDPALPADTLIVTVHGPESGRVGELIEARILRPFLEWLRALTDQWWIGRSYELISGPLHFIAPVDEANSVLGQPTPVASMTTGGSRMLPINTAIWSEAAKRAIAGDPSAERGLATDAKYMFVSKEFRSGVILAFCAFEAARDAILDRSAIKLSGPQNILEDQLANGFEKTFGRNIAKERPDLASLVKTFRRARNDAAHGKKIRWRSNGQAFPIEELSVPDFTSGIDEILAWMSTIAKNSDSHHFPTR